MARTKHAKTKYIITDHAAQRFRERVSAKGAHSTSFKNRVSEWVENAMNHSTKLGRDRDGCELYRFTDYVIVLKHGTKVITIKPYKSFAEQTPDLTEAIKDSIRRQVAKALRPHLIRQQELLIEIHTDEWKKLRANNPQTQSIIERRIDGLNEQLDFVKRQITSVSAVAYEHGIKIEEMGV